MEKGDCIITVFIFFCKGDIYSHIWNLARHKKVKRNSLKMYLAKKYSIWLEYYSGIYMWLSDPTICDSISVVLLLQICLQLYQSMGVSLLSLAFTICRHIFFCNFFLTDISEILRKWCKMQNKGCDWFLAFCHFQTRDPNVPAQ